MLAFTTYVPHYVEIAYTDELSQDEDFAKIENLLNNRTTQMNYEKYKVLNSENSFYYSLKFDDFLLISENIYDSSTTETQKLEQNGKIAQNCPNSNSSISTLQNENLHSFTTTIYGSRVNIPYYVTSSIMSFKMTCENQQIKANTEIAVFLGIVLGAILNGITSDIFGRRKSYIFYTFGLVFSALFLVGASGFFDFASSVGLNLFLFGQMLLGTCGIASYMTVLILINELVDTKNRTMAQFISMLGFELAAIFVPILLYFFNYWFEIYIFLGFLALLFSIAVLKFVPESPRYLVKCGRNGEAKVLLSQIRMINSGRKGLFSGIGSLKKSNESEFDVDLVKSEDILIKDKDSCTNITNSEIFELETTRTTSNSSASSSTTPTTKNLKWTHIFTKRTYLKRFVIIKMDPYFHQTHLPQKICNNFPSLASFKFQFL